VGLDIGGSTSRGRLVEDGRLLAEAEAGAANLAAVGEEQAARELGDLLGRLAAAPVAVACAGAAGADGPVQRRRMEALLGRLLPGARLLVVHDARLVLAAAGLDAGIVLIAGTGSVACGWDAAGREARAGGWGHLLGDEGSGYWIVREGIRRVLADADRGRPPGPLARVLLDGADARDAVELLHAFHERREPGRWAAMAGQVLAAEPALAAAAGRELAEACAVVADRLGERGPVVLAGGLLLHEPALEGAVRAALAARLPGAEVLRLEQPPVAGAVRLAQHLLG
jgi:glucosamine kinase